MISVSKIVCIYNYARATITLNNYFKKIIISIEWMFLAKKKKINSEFK